MQDSSKRRDGGKVYEHQLVSGASFSKQIRRKNRGIELKSEVSYAREEEKVERQFGAAVRFCCWIFVCFSFVTAAQ